MKIVRISALYILSFSLLLNATVQSQTSDSARVGQPIKRPRFEIQVNGIYASMETNLRFESSNGILGVKINFEDNLGMRMNAG